MLRQTEAGDIPGAIEAYEALLAVQPQSEVAANNLAMILVADGPNQDLGRAMVESFTPDKPTSLTHWGVYLHTDKLTQAIYFLEEAVGLPRNQKFAITWAGPMFRPISLRPQRQNQRWPARRIMRGNGSFRHANCWRSYNEHTSLLWSETIHLR